jgi:hypothetical protein
MGRQGNDRQTRGLRDGKHFRILEDISNNPLCKDRSLNAFAYIDRKKPLLPLEERPNQVKSMQETGVVTISRLEQRDAMCKETSIYRRSLRLC